MTNPTGPKKVKIGLAIGTFVPLTIITSTLPGNATLFTFVNSVTNCAIAAISRKPIPASNNIAPETMVGSVTRITPPGI